MNYKKGVETSIVGIARNKRLVILLNLTAFLAICLLPKGHSY